MESENVFEFQRCERAAGCFAILSCMKKNDELCDVSICAGNQSFQAHRVILAAGIPYFRAMFCSNMVECTKKEIILQDVDPSALEQLINFVYTHKLKITLESVESLLKASMYLQLDDVVDACFEFLSERISCSTVLVTHSCAVLANRVNMIENADQFIRENFEVFSLSNEFVSLPFTMLKDIICKDDLFVMKEEIVFEAIIRWVKASEVDRQARLPELLPHIRMPLITEEYLNLHICSEELIQALPACRDMVNEAIKYHTSKDKTASFGFETRERFCERKNHLKCAKLQGCGLYVICKGPSNVFVNYYDPINKILRSLGDPLTIDSVHLKYVACMEDVIYFLYDKCIWVLNLKTLHLTLWEHNFKLPSACGIVVRESKLYLCGGIAGMSSGVHTFDLQNISLVRKGNMLHKRVCPSAASMGEFIYITGGLSGNTWLRCAEKYNCVTEQRYEIAEMLIKRFGHGCTALNDRIYVCGGICRGVTIPGETYDPVSDQWNLISRLTTIAGYSCLLSYVGELSLIDNRVWSENGLLVKTYNPSEGKWQFGIPCSFSSVRCEFLSAVVTDSASPLITNLIIPWEDISLEDGSLSESFEDNTDSD